MTKVNVNYDQYCDVTRESDPDNQWDCDDLYYYTDIKSISIVNDKYAMFDVPFNIEHNVPYYLLYVVYSTGDSFHHEEGRVEFVGLYSKKSIAEINKQRILEHQADDQYSVVLMFETDKGDTVEHKLSVPWTGYFESLTSVEIQPVYVDN